MAKKYSVFEITLTDTVDRLWRTAREMREVTCVLETRKVADAISYAEQSDTLAVVNTYGECFSNAEEWADVHINDKPVVKRAASPVFSRLAVASVSRDAATGRVAVERREFSPIIRLIETEDHPGSCCPHCGAEGRYVKVFECEDGAIRKAMAGCYAAWPKSKRFKK